MAGAPGRRIRGLSLPVAAAEELQRPGRPLDSATRSDLEPGLGHDFGKVRIHTGPGAARSAEAVGARAFTVGHHVVMGRGGPRPSTSPERALLGHELAHAVQQGGRPSASPRGTGQALESEAVAWGRRLVGPSPLGGGEETPAPVGRSPGLALARDGDPPPDAAARAREAELFCDFRTLCRLRFQAPEVVTPERVRRVWGSCHPGAGLITMDPCLMPISPTVSPAPGPRRSPAPSAAPGPAPAPAPAPAAPAGGLALPSTTIRFNLGAARFTIDLPASLAVRLPVPFEGAEQVAFSMDVGPSGLSLGVTINAVPHVRIQVRGGVTTEGVASAGLVVETTRRVCRATTPGDARSALEGAGNRLRDAIRAVQEPPEPDPDASELETTFAPHARLAEVVSSVANLHSTIQRVGAGCSDVPLATFEFGARGPVQLPWMDEAPTTPGYIGGTATFRF